MGGRDQVDVMTADSLEVKHHFCQVIICNRFPKPLVGNGPVLAEHAAEIAVGKKDGAGPILTN